MDANIQRALNDKLYDKRKVGALECVNPKTLMRMLKLTRPPCRLERVIRDLVTAKDFQRVYDVLEQLCNEYAYAVHQPHARNGGLIGLAAAAIALGPVCEPARLSPLPPKGPLRPLPPPPTLLSARLTLVTGAAAISR